MTKRVCLYTSKDRLIVWALGYEEIAEGRRYARQAGFRIGEIHKRPCTPSASRAIEEGTWERDCVIFDDGTLATEQDSIGGQRVRLYDDCVIRTQKRWNNE